MANDPKAVVEALTSESSRIQTIIRMTNIRPEIEESRVRRESTKRLTLVKSSAVACVYALILMNGLARAQTPKDSPPPMANAAPLATQTSDGRAFSALSEKDVDALSDADFDAYQKWRIRGKEQELARVTAENAELDKTLARVTAENAELDKKALQNVTTKWKDVSAQLQLMPQDKVIAHLSSDLEPYRRLLTYVVANKIEPLEYARILLTALNEKSKTE